MPKQKKSESRVPRRAKPLLKAISRCRHQECPVVARHAFYWSEEPVAPVVPSYLKLGNIMIVAAYPTAMFVNFETEKHIPYYDVSEPLADYRYYDGTGVRDVKAGTYFDRAYLTPLGLRRKDLWITNTVKCFLFDKKQARRHRKLPLIKPIRIEPTRERFFDCARPCVETHLLREVKICKPKLILTIGAEAAEAIHGTFGKSKKRKDDVPGGKLIFSRIVGVPLRADKRMNKYDKREGIFFKTNIFHLIHPGYLMRVPYGKLSKEHWSKHLPAAFEFIKELGIEQFRDKVGVRDRNLKKGLKEIEIESKHEIDHGATRVTL
ncbi:MAG: hypothetical protein J7L54_06145 [Elusimicrobia bacterium]|nr:hypothetical protein [Elusimicrobiota bacterium]